jgi:hypothetical protein
MITFNNIGYMGRFGNQMFQFASTVGISRKLGLDPVFPKERFLNNLNPDSYDGCKLLECFNIPENMLTPSSEISIKYIYNENKFGYNEETLSLPDSTSLNGYFQTEKYFKSIEDEIRKIFTFRNEIIEYANANFKIESGISLHVRRGDYLSSPGHHPTQSIEYYKKSISEFDKDAFFYIFSDDPDWCRANLEIENSEIIVSENPYIDMYLMTLCDGHIIANSSFSWWGAWLSKKGGTVIAPSKWFGPLMGKDPSDVYCENWKII